MREAAARVRALLLSALLAATAAWAANDSGVVAVESPRHRSAAELMDAVMWNREPIGGPFRLVDTTGRERRDTDFRGKVLVVYFGYTTCPDVCPTDLYQIAQALQSLGAAGDDVVPVFITLDPKRDTPALLAEYVKNFDARIVALTGTPEAIGAVAQAYRVYSRQVMVESALKYTVDHSAFVYVVGRDGKYVGFVPPGSGAGRIAAVLKGVLSLR